MSEPTRLLFSTPQEARRWLRLARQSHLAILIGDVQSTDDGQHAVCFYRPTLTADLWQRTRGRGAR